MEESALYIKAEGERRKTYTCFKHQTIGNVTIWTIWLDILARKNKTYHREEELLQYWTEYLEPFKAVVEKYISSEIFSHYFSNPSCVEFERNIYNSYDQTSLHDSGSGSFVLLIGKPRSLVISPSEDKQERYLMHDGDAVFIKGERSFCITLPDDSYLERKSPLYPSFVYILRKRNYTGMFIL